ncbi:hypothetical protein OIU74_010123 [Salix koriyanagi]|uniref:Uncharacterized protein n=1 Tax=Salix koriyanagi TaxID=2511006 RepID=A0A9Q0QLL9_9ROSI|nr:hypothetical protein OIU74_010123 [Salix koriyanagi]
MLAPTESSISSTTSSIFLSIWSTTKLGKFELSSCMYCGSLTLPGKVTGSILSSGNEIHASKSDWHFPKTAQKHKFGLASSKKGKTKHLAGMEHPAGPVAFNEIGMSSLARRETKNSKHASMVRYDLVSSI